MLDQNDINMFISECLRYIADLNIPIKTGTFIEFRNGMINVSPIGRNCSQSERDEFELYDYEYHIRVQMIKYLQEKFPNLNLDYSIGGQISFDVFPKNFNKTFCLQFINEKQIHFFGDKTDIGGNDYEIYNDPRVIGHKVESYLDTIKICSQILIPYIPVIMCGGSDSRLFPKSRENFPKQFIKIEDNYSLLQNTILRFNNMNHIIIVSNINHQNILHNQINELIDNQLIDKNIKFQIYLEPISRNTAPIINLITQIYPNNYLLFLPCDHIYDTHSLHLSINKSIKLSNNNIWD
jgi:hypothetical protein